MFLKVLYSSLTANFCSMNTYPVSFRISTIVLLKPHLTLSGCPFINNITLSEVVKSFSLSSSVGGFGNIFWNSPDSMSSLTMSTPPTSWPLTYSWGNVGQFEKVFNPCRTSSSWRISKCPNFTLDKDKAYRNIKLNILARIMNYNNYVKSDLYWITKWR